MKGLLSLISGSVALFADAKVHEIVTAANSISECSARLEIDCHRLGLGQSASTRNIRVKKYRLGSDLC